jgi:hypothetical protein
MFARFRFALFVPLALSGCGVATRVQTAFQMPAPRQPRLAIRAGARQAPEFDSLSHSLSNLDRTTLDTLITRWKSAPAKSGSSAPRAPLPSPSALALNPALALAQTQTASSPLLGSGRIGDFASVALPPVAPAFGTGNGPSLRFLAPKILGARLPLATGTQASGSGDLRAFLSGWAARQSLARADEELLGRRALGERIALQSRAALAELDLSLVPPDVQLELTNLRLELVPLLRTSAAKRARAQARIDAIEARLRRIWEGETERQARLWRQSLEEVPARLAREGEAALTAQRQKQTRLDFQDRARVRNELRLRLKAQTLPVLAVRQNGVLAPDAGRVRAFLQAPLAFPPRSVPATSSPLPVDEAPLSGAAKNSGSAARMALLAARQEKVWRAATR